MEVAPLALAAMAVLLAWPVPVALARARWPHQSPAIALLLWQSIALAGGLSMIGALLTAGLAPFGTDLVHSAIGLASGEGEPSLLHLFALSAAVLLTAHLLVNLAATLVRSERQRRRHAHLVNLLSSPFGAGARMIESATPVAYCLPGALRSVTVFSAGLLELLDPRELEAVVEHERAHVEQRHDIVLIAFRAWNASLPWFPIAYRAQREVGVLIEMLADDRARRHVDDAALARAIAIVGSAGSAGSAPVSAADLSERIRRFELAPLAPHARLLVGSAAVALLAVPTALLIAPALAGLAG